jgi:hypothetical protein
MAMKITITTSKRLIPSYSTETAYEQKLKGKQKSSRLGEETVMLSAPHGRGTIACSGAMNKPAAVNRCVIFVKY